MQALGATLHCDPQRVRQDGCRSAAPFENSVRMHPRESPRRTIEIKRDGFGVGMKHAHYPLCAVAVQAEEVKRVVLAGGKEPREIEGGHGDIQGCDGYRHGPVLLL